MEYITDWRILNNKVREYMVTESWSNLCRLIKNSSNEAYCGMMSYLNDAIEKAEEDGDLLKSSFLKISEARETPIIVEYVVKKDIVSEFMKASSLDRNLLVKDIYKLPYPCMSISIEGVPKYNYLLLSESKEDVAIINFSTNIIEKELTMGYVYDHCKDEDQALDQTVMACLISYLNNNKDVLCKSVTIELSNGSPSKKRKKKPKKIKQITGIVGGIFHRSMCRWKEAQETEYQNNPELRGKQKPHCRPGHWQIYWVGKGRTEARPTFVHPYLVNATEIGDTEIHYKVK